jgi:hypothetical protein
LSHLLNRLFSALIYVLPSSTTTAPVFFNESSLLHLHHLLLLDFLLSPLYYLLDVLILDLHQPLLVLFLQVSIDLLDLHHLLEYEVAVFGRLETPAGRIAGVRVLRSCRTYSISGDSCLRGISGAPQFGRVLGCTCVAGLMGLECCRRGRQLVELLMVLIEQGVLLFSTSEVRAERSCLLDIHTIRVVGLLKILRCLILMIVQRI